MLGQGVPKELKMGPCHSLIKGALDDLVQVPILGLIPVSVKWKQVTVLWATGRVG